MKLFYRILAALLLFNLLPAAFAKHAPNLELKDLSGNKRQLADLRGSIVVFNFWATWCGPCRAELPMLTSLSREYGAKNVRFIAASVDAPKTRNKIAPFLSENGITLEVWVGADLDMLEHGGLGNVLPGTLIIDDQGDVVARIMGQAREDDIRQPLDWLLSGKSGTPPQEVIKRY
jgi:thiol-disulfide isomerase/thioredoxin